MRAAVGPLVLAALIALGGCRTRLDPLPPLPDQGAPADLSAPRDLATLPDGKRHVGEPCATNADCLSNDCLVPELTRGYFDHICSGGPCDPTRPCAEGGCVSFDFGDTWWCLPTCGASGACPASLTCCMAASGAVCSPSTPCF